MQGLIFMLNVIIPMAGAGSRFKIAGYSRPKPFIDINGKMMIERVLDGIIIPNAHYTLIIQKQFELQNRDALDILSEKYNFAVLTVDELTQGACCTALASHSIINNNIPVAFVDSDNIFDKNIFSDFISFSKSMNIDGSLLTVQSNNPSYSYAKTIDGLVTETREKEVFSNHAITGVYFFSKGIDFCTSAIDLLIYGKKTKNEFYMSNVYNRAIQYYGLKIKVFDIPEEKWHCVGTPELLTQYIKTINNIGPHK